MFLSVHLSWVTYHMAIEVRVIIFISFSYLFVYLTIPMRVFFFWDQLVRKQHAKYESMFLFATQTLADWRTYTHMHIYIYIYVCVCVCVWTGKANAQMECVLRIDKVYDCRNPLSVCLSDVTQNKYQQRQMFFGDIILFIRSAAIFSEWLKLFWSKSRINHFYFSDQQPGLKISWWIKLRANTCTKTHVWFSVS